VDPSPEITNSNTDVTNHKRATPKTSLLSRAACRSLILFSLCNFMSINNRCPAPQFRLHLQRKKKIIVETHGNYFLRTTITKKNTQGANAKNLQEAATVLNPENLSGRHSDVERG
jgi:hypothetical protein